MFVDLGHVQNLLSCQLALSLSLLSPLRAAWALREQRLAGRADDVPLLALVDGRPRDVHAHGALKFLLKLAELVVRDRSLPGIEV